VKLQGPGYAALAFAGDHQSQNFTSASCCRRGKGIQENLFSHKKIDLLMRVEEFCGFRRAKAPVISNAPCSSQSCRVLVPEGHWERNSDLVGALMGRVEIGCLAVFRLWFAALLRAALSDATVRLIQRPPAVRTPPGQTNWQICLLTPLKVLTVSRVKASGILIELSLANIRSAARVASLSSPSTRPLKQPTRFSSNYSGKERTLQQILQAERLGRGCI
jgi:hypothetical protein